MIKPTYYYIIPKKLDNQGLTHGYRTFISKRQERDEFDQYPMGSEIKFDDYREGAPRLYEVPRFDSSIYPLLLVSENIKSFLFHFKLPKHNFTHKKLIHYKLTSETEFYILQLKEDTLLEFLNWKQTEFFYTLKSSPKSLENKLKVKSEINNKDDIFQERMRLKEEQNVKTIYIHPLTFSQVEHLDIITYNYPYTLGKVIMVVDYLKTAFEKYFPNQVDFMKVEKLDILVDKKAYLTRKQAAENLDFNPNRLHYEVDQEFLFYNSKMLRLTKQEVGIPDNYDKNDDFTLKERELKKVFPSEFKKLYKSKPELKDFEIIPIKDFHIEDNYQLSLPQTYGAVIFAKDGSGEGLGLLLKKDSDYELGNQWFYFSHEDGNVFEINDLSDYIKF